MTAAVEHAGQDWADAAYAWLVARLRAYPRLYPDDARHNGCPVPPSGNWRALGAVYRRASNAGLMVKDGAAPRASGHLALAPVWRSLIWEGAA